MELPRDIRSRIEQDLAAGYAVMLPKNPVSFDGRELIGWWRIQRETGEALGIGERGWGQTTVEWILYGVFLYVGLFYLYYYFHCLDPSSSKNVLLLKGVTPEESEICLICATWFAFFGLVGLLTTLAAAVPLWVGLALWLVNLPPCETIVSRFVRELRLSNLIAAWDKMGTF